MTQRWIVGIDDSELAARALRWAVDRAASHDARITAVGAFHVPATMSLFIAKRGFGVDEVGLRATAAHHVDEAIAQARSDVAAGQVDIEPHIVEGHPGPVLVEIADDVGDLLVVGRQGGGGLGHDVLGSVSRHCATHSSIPVAVIPPVWHPEPDRLIVVGFDGSDNAKAALRWTMAFALPEATVRVVCAIEPVAWLDALETVERYHHEVAEHKKDLGEAIDTIDPEGRTERAMVTSGPRYALTEAATHADLVVVGARGSGRIASALLGSISTWALHDARCPVVVVPHGDEPPAESR